MFWIIVLVYFQRTRIIDFFSFLFYDFMHGTKQEHDGGIRKGVSVSPLLCSIQDCWGAAPATNLNLEMCSLTYHPCPSVWVRLSQDTWRVTLSIILKYKMHKVH